jgi:hypothetical protein
MPTRGLSLLDLAPALDRAPLHEAIARAALEAGRDPLTRYAPLRPPSPEGASPP